MADDAQGTTAPATHTDPAVPPAAPDKPRVQADELPPAALKARLEAEAERTRRAVLAELGVSDTKDAKAALAELKKRQDAERTEQERLTARVAELEAQSTKAASYAAVIAGRAAAELAALPEKTRSYVTAEAGDDAAKQLATIDRLRSTGLLTEAPVAPAVAPTAPASAPSTAPRPGAPPEAGTVQSSSERETFEKLRETNPFRAAYYAQANAGKLFTT